MTSSDESSVMTYEVSNGVALITFNRPEQLNSQTAEFWLTWFELVDRANADEQVGAIVSTGRGRAFCSGGDIRKEFLPRVTGEIPWLEEDPYMGGLGFPGDWLTLVRESKPMIAAVNGLAIGGGATAVLPFDIIVVSTKAEFVFPFVRLGLSGEIGSTHYLAARVGFGRASEILLSGRPVGAEEAVNIGLANHMVPQEDLLDRVMEMAGGIAGHPGAAALRNKQLLTANWLERDHSAIFRRESDALRTGFQSTEHREALRRFLQDRDSRSTSGG